MKYSRKRRGGKAGDFELAKELQKEQSALEKKKKVSGRTFQKEYEK